MRIYLDKEIFDTLMADYVGPVVSASVQDSLDSERVIAVCRENGPTRHTDGAKWATLI